MVLLAKPTPQVPQQHREGQLTANLDGSLELLLFTALVMPIADQVSTPFLQALNTGLAVSFSKHNRLTQIAASHYILIKLTSGRISKSPSKYFFELITERECTHQN